MADLHGLIGRTADYIVNERESAILHTIVSDTLMSFASEASWIYADAADKAENEAWKLRELLAEVEVELSAYSCDQALVDKVRAALQKAEAA
jgi:RecB family exonuclease